MHLIEAGRLRLNYLLILAYNVQRRMAPHCILAHNNNIPDIKLQFPLHPLRLVQSLTVVVDEHRTLVLADFLNS